MTTKTIQMYRTNLDGSETTLYPLTEAKYVTMNDGTTIEEALTNSDSSKYSPVIESSKAVFKVGEGDSVDLSESAIDGAYNSCVLKGKTMVNCIQEPSSQDVVLPYEFEDGQYVTINDTKESGALGVELKGQTLVNLVPKKIIDYTASSDWDGYHQLVQNSKQSFDQWRALQDLKPNTKYYISCYVETFEVVNNEGYRLNNPSVESIFGDSMIVNGVGRYQWLSTTKSELTDEIFMALRCQNAFARGAIKIRDIMIIEYQEGMEEWDIPYFEGMASCKMPILRTIGKNLCDNSKNFIGNINGVTGVFDELKASILSMPIKVNHKNYVGSRVVSSNSSVTFNQPTYRVYNSNMNYIGSSLSDLPETGGYVILRCIKSDGSLFLDNELSLIEFQLEENTRITQYEPYKSSILSLPEEVVLRSLPNGVCDTFNTRTGVYTQRIEEIILNGEIRLFEKSCEDIEYYRVATDIIDNFKLNSCMVNNMLPVAKMVTSSTTGEFVGDHVNSHCIHIRLLSSKLSQRSVSGVQEYLQSNPITVQYELATPIVTKISLQSTLKSWNTTTHIYSEIPENSLYPILSHSNPSHPVILKPSTKYSIVANSYSNDHTNSAINFNLGGATASATVGNRVTTITTPSTLSNELLTMSGRGNKLNNVMVIEGDVVGDEPYFEGICDCKSPILSNVGKNLFDVDYFVKKVNNPNVCYKNEEGSLVIKGSYHSVKINVPYSTTITYLQTSTNTANNGASIFEAQHPDGTCTHIGVGVNTTLERKTLSIKKPIIAIGFNNWAGGENILKDIMLVKTESSTAYEPYKSNTTTFDQKDDKTIVLRSLQNGVCDTLNVETGEYVQRIGEVVFDGSSDEEMWYNSNWANGDYVACYWNVNAMGLPNKKTGAQNMVCDSFPTVTSSIVNTGGIVTREGIWGEAGSSVMYISIKKTKLTELNVTGFRQWVSQNPITVQYELETPIVSTIDVQGFPYAYKDGHVQLSSGSIEQSLTPKVEYSLVANKSGQINSNTKRVSAHQKQLDDFEAMMLTSMVQSAYDKAILQFDYEMQMMSLGGE